MVKSGPWNLRKRKNMKLRSQYLKRDCPDAKLRKSPIPKITKILNSEPSQKIFSVL
jgi:hypothetical protein